MLLPVAVTTPLQCELLQGCGEKGGLLCCILIRAWASPPSEEVFVLTPAI